MWPGRWLIPSSRTRRIPLNGFCGFTEEYPVKNTHWVRVFTVTRGSCSDCPRVYVRICSVLTRKWPTEQLEQLGDMLNSSKVNLAVHKSGQRWRCPNADQNALTGDRCLSLARCLFCSLGHDVFWLHLVSVHRTPVSMRLACTHSGFWRTPKRPKGTDQSDQKERRPKSTHTMYMAHTKGKRSSGWLIIPRKKWCKVASLSSNFNF